MSYTAVHDVTKALQRLLYSQLSSPGQSAVVTLLPPGDTLPEVYGVNLYLYRVVESPFTKNQPWPGDLVTPPSDKPPLGLQLFYLLTPLGTKPDQDSLEGDHAHTVLGRAMLTLHEQAVLNDVHIPGFDADVELSAPLRNSYERIKVTLMPIGLEELSKIWATINKPYRLSVAYEVSLVELTPSPLPPITAGIVTTPRVDVITMEAPRLTELSPATGALARLAGGLLVASELEIRGFGLSFPGQTLVVHVGGELAPIASGPDERGQTLTVTLPTDLRAGPSADVEVTLNHRTSAPLTFTVAPWLASLTPIRTALRPSAGAPPELILRGSGLSGVHSVRLEGPGGSVDLATVAERVPGAEVDVSLPPTLGNGLYRVRAILDDGAHSASNSRLLEVVPRVDVATARQSTVISPPATWPVHTITVVGERLKGSDVRLILDDVVYQVGANASPTQVVYTLGRLLSPVPHAVAVSVDGHVSGSVALEILP